MVCEYGQTIYKGSCYSHAEDIPFENISTEVFFFSYRLQYKLIIILILLQVLMILFRITLRIYEKITYNRYLKRVLMKNSLKLSLSKEYLRFARKVGFHKNNPSMSSPLHSFVQTGTPSPTIIPKRGGPTQKA